MLTRGHQTMCSSPKDVNLLPFDEALDLYEKMRQAYYDDDSATIETLKKDYPTLFEAKTANLLRTTVDLLHKMQKQKPKFSIH